MEHIIGTGVSICMGLTVFSILVVVVLAIASKMHHKHRIQELGDAWLRAVDTGPDDSRGETC